MEQAGSVFKSEFLFSPRRPVVDAFSGSGSGFSLCWSWSCFPIFDSILRFCFYLLGEGVFLFPHPFLVRLMSLWHCILEILCVPFCTHLVMGSVGEFTVLIWVGYTWTPFGVLGIYFELDTGIESRISSGAIEAL